MRDPSRWMRDRISREPGMTAAAMAGTPALSIAVILSAAGAIEYPVNTDVPNGTLAVLA